MKPERQKVCILGGGFENKGAEAMVLTVASAIRSRRPSARIYVRLPRADFPSAKMNALLPLDGRFKRFTDRLKSKLHTARLMAGKAMLIDVAGFQFGDAWPSEIAQRRARTVRAFVRAGSRFVFMPQAWGPFENPQVADATREIIDTATMAFVRDRTSLKAVEQLVGSAHPRVRFAHDVAWNFVGADPARAKELIRAAGVPDERPLTVCVTPNMRVYERSEGKGLENQYVRMLLSIVQHLCKAHGASVVLLGHELRQPGSRDADDRFL
jgi:colanic acid/amylovoran biosynthesis protein